MALSIAPMYGWTDQHYRRMARLATRRVLLYTEMHPATAVLDAAARGGGALEALLGSPAEVARQQPVAAQLGGNDPVAMGEAAAHCAHAGYTEVNINVGCEPLPHRPRRRLLSHGPASHTPPRSINHSLQVRRPPSPTTDVTARV